MRFYMGSYTKMGGVGVGLCSFEDGQIRLLTSDALPNATYVILNRNRTRLYAICSDPLESESGGSVAAYDVAKDELRLLSRCDTIGAGPCHLCLDAQERFLYTANYFSGSVSVFSLDEDGGIGKRLAHICHSGRSVHPTRQTGPHVHQVSFIPGTDLLCAVDLGLDQLVIYRQDQVTGLLERVATSSVPAGFGPRHLLYGRAGTAYLVGEVSNHVATLQWDGQGFRVMQTLSTLPDDYKGTNTASAIRMMAGRVYVSNRGHNSIAVYDVLQDGLLAPKTIWPTGGDFPRDFDFVDEDTLLIGHQNGALTAEKMTHEGLECIGQSDTKGCVCILVMTQEG